MWSLIFCVTHFIWNERVRCIDTARLRLKHTKIPWRQTNLLCRFKNFLVSSPLLWRLAHDQKPSILLILVGNLTAIAHNQGCWGHQYHIHPNLIIQSVISSMKNKLAAFDFDDTRHALIIPDVRAVDRINIVDRIQGQRRHCVIAPVVVKGELLTLEAIVGWIVSVSYKPCLLQEPHINHFTRIVLHAGRLENDGLRHLWAIVFLINAAHENVPRLWFVALVTKKQARHILLA